MIFQLCWCGLVTKNVLEDHVINVYYVCMYDSKIIYLHLWFFVFSLGNFDYFFKAGCFHVSCSLQAFVMTCLASTSKLSCLYRVFIMLYWKWTWLIFTKLILRSSSFQGHNSLNYCRGEWRTLDEILEGGNWQMSQMII